LSNSTLCPAKRDQNVFL